MTPIPLRGNNPPWIKKIYTPAELLSLQSDFLPITEKSITALQQRLLRDNPGSYLKADGSIGILIDGQERLIALGNTNNAGLPNHGFDVSLELAEGILLERPDKRILFSTGGNTVESYDNSIIVVAKFVKSHLIFEGKIFDETNDSCPNQVTDSQLKGYSSAQVGRNPELIYEIMSNARKIIDKMGIQLPISVKLTPNMGGNDRGSGKSVDIWDAADAALSAGADAITNANTYAVIRYQFDSKTGKYVLRDGEKVPVHQYPNCGLGGAVIFDNTIANTKYLREKMVANGYGDKPIFFTGGISSPRDIAEAFMAGASLVQVGNYKYERLKFISEIDRSIHEYFSSLQLPGQQETKFLESHID